MPNFVVISQAVAEIMAIFYFQGGGRQLT